MLLGWLLGSSLAIAQAPAGVDPNRVKAAFLRNFAHYVTWPSGTFGSAHAPWHVGVLGDATFCEVVEKTLKGRTERDREFKVECADSLGRLPPCQIVFVAINDEDRRRLVLAELKDKPVLTVGDAPEFLREGGVVRLDLGERVQMSVNLDQARSVALTIQSAMLEVAREVLENGAVSKRR
jgi:hypothetical protein